MINYDYFIHTIDKLKSELYITNYIESNYDILYNLSEKYINHQFNLLGSGWVKISLDSTYLDYRGVHFDNIMQKDKFIHIANKINNPNKKYSQKIIELLPIDYELIDWQRDFRTGYRWDENKLSLDNHFGNIIGVDVKHPWELGRMQHLVNFYYMWKYTDNDKYANEYRNQILDFIACNPPQYGIQWKIAMDPGIRAINWIITYSLFKSENYNFDFEFDRAFIESIYNHYHFVKNNLEWGSGIRGNHYFANITSLLIILLFLNDDSLSSDFDNYLNQFKNEIEYQFLNDGGNFEGSLPYHYFTLEMLNTTLYFLINSQWQTKKITEFLDKIYNNIFRIFIFSINNINSDRIQNFGDNDSGYFFRFHLPFTISKYSLDTDINNYTEHNELINIIAKYFEFQLIQLDSFPFFGIYNIIKDKYNFHYYSSQFSKKNRGAHQHNDITSYTLQILDNDFIIDSGTFNYTAFPDLRNQFRSIVYHNTLQLDNLEQRDIPIDNNKLLFWLIDKQKMKFDQIEENYISSKHYFFDCETSRTIRFEDKKIYFEDKCNSDKIKIIRNILSPAVIITNLDNNIVTTIINNIQIKFIFYNSKVEIREIEISQNYGSLTKSNIILATSLDQTINWELEIIDEIN